MELYKQFSEKYVKYEKNKKENADNRNKDSKWEKLKYCMVVASIFLAVGAIIGLIMGEALCGYIGLVVSILLLWGVALFDQKKYSEEYKNAEKRRMETVEETICEITALHELDLQTICGFYEMMDESSKKLWQRKILTFVINIACVTLEFETFCATVFLGVNHDIQGIVALGGFFVLQKVTGNGTLKKYMLGESYYVSLVGRYVHNKKQLLVQ